MLTDKEKLFLRHDKSSPGKTHTRAKRIHLVTTEPTHTTRHTQHAQYIALYKYARVYIPHKKNIVLIIVKMNVILKYCRIFAA